MNSHELKINELLPQLELYSENDPDKFEAIRDEIIYSAIQSYPAKYRKRAQGIQFSLDCELRKYKNPVTRMNRMVELFWGKVHEFNFALNKPAEFVTAREEHRKPAKVISLFAERTPPQESGCGIES